jgi:Domain of unknown function (DUF4145)
VTPQLDKNYNISAQCPGCKVLTSFDQKGVHIVEGSHAYNGNNYQRVLYVFSHCVRCGRGGIATVPDNGNSATAVLEDFYPLSVDTAPLPSAVPPEIQNEFREAERCAAFGANRAASALFRSVLEKTLKLNGYTRSNDSSFKDLQKRIDAAAADGVITDARRRRAHDEIRSLGNDVLHDDWREVAAEEVEDSHRYTQRILEDLYDDRSTVETLLRAKNRLPAPPATA